MTDKSDHAQRLLNDPLLKEAFEKVREVIHQGWAASKPTDRDAQYEWHRRLLTLDSVEQNLRQFITDGKLEDFRANQKPAPLGDLTKWRRKLGL